MIRKCLALVFAPLVLFLLAAAVPARAFLFVAPAPPLGEGPVAVPGGPFSDLAGTAQVGYGHSLFSGISLGSKVTGIAFRLDGDGVTGPAIDLLFSQWDLQMSQSLNAPFSLSPTFANNIASDVVLVRSGPLTLTANSLIDLGSPVPNPFLTIPFTVPYTFTGGDLLLTLRKSGHSGDASDDPLIDAIDNTGSLIENILGRGWGSVVTTSASAASGFVNFVNVPVTAFVFEPPARAPLPGTLALFALGLAGLGWSRRRK